MKLQSLKERGIEKPQGSRAKKASRLNGTAHTHARNGTKPIKAAKAAKLHLTVAQRKQVISEWMYLVNFVEAVASNDFQAFARLTMTHLQLIVARIEPPPAKGSPSDLAVDEFAKSMAAMMVRTLTEVLTESDDVVRKRVLGGTLIEAIGPRPLVDPRTHPSLRRIEVQQEKPLERQARESVST